MNAITIPLEALRDALRGCMRRRSRSIRLPAIFSRWADGIEVAVSPRAVSLDGYLVLSVTDDPAPSDGHSAGFLGALQVGYQKLRGRASGWVMGRRSQMDEAHVLKLVGPGMFSVPLTSELHSDNRAQCDIERWSRTIGALGREAWERLTGLRYAVVGLGRTGSSVAVSLARLGVRRLILVDPDLVELHNLGEMDGISTNDIGWPKVKAVASALRSINPVINVIEVPASITRLSAVSTAAEADVLFCCVDNDGARLATAAVAAAFLRVLVDIATGVHGDRGARVLGADVRLVLPGRDLFCLGGLRDEGVARRMLESADSEETFLASREWHRERAGSIASLNQCATALAVRLVEDLVGERIGESLWVHLEFDSSGRPSIGLPETGRALGPEQCPLCRLGGLGFSGLRLMGSLLVQ